MGFIDDDTEASAFDLVDFLVDYRELLQGRDDDPYSVIDCVPEICGCHLVIYGGNCSHHMVKARHRSLELGVKIASVSHDDY